MSSIKIKIILFLYFGTLLAFSSYAEKIEGQIIDKNDTLEVTFNIPTHLLAQTPNYEKLQRKVKYFDAEGKKSVLKPSEGISFQFYYRGENIRMLAMSNSAHLGGVFGKSMIFLKLEIDGPLRLFRHYFTPKNPALTNPANNNLGTNDFSATEETILLQRKDEKMKTLNWLGFKKDMVKYFKDCPNLVEKIRNKEFRKKDIEVMAVYYNRQCGQ